MLPMVLPVLKPIYLQLLIVVCHFWVCVQLLNNGIYSLNPKQYASYFFTIRYDIKQAKGQSIK